MTNKYFAFTNKTPYLSLVSVPRWESTLYFESVQIAESQYAIKRMYIKMSGLFLKLLLNVILIVKVNLFYHEFIVELTQKYDGRLSLDSYELYKNMLSSGFCFKIWGSIPWKVHFLILCFITQVLDINKNGYFQHVLFDIFVTEYV